MKKAVFQLETLTCPSCIKKIETTLDKMNGVQAVQVLFNSSKVRTEYNESVIEASQIEATISKLGFEVLSMKVS